MPATRSPALQPARASSPGDSESIVENHFAGATPKPDWIRDDDAFPEADEQLRAYFAGELQTFARRWPHKEPISKCPSGAR
jgi:hypothetical protein